MNFVYGCSCESCETIATLSLGMTNKDDFKPVLNAGEKAFKRLQEKGSYKPEDLKKEPAYQDLINENYKVLNFAIQDNDMSDTMEAALQNDAFLFGGLKIHAQLLEGSKLLLDDSGKVKSFSQVENDFNKLNDTYNRNYLQSEYQFAVSSAQMASKWNDFDNSGHYSLEYRTAGDNHVRAEHQTLAGIVLPKEDEFWDSYYPPNGWKCRCSVSEVLNSKYDKSNSDKSIALGDAATTKIGKNGKNSLEMFRFNPGKQQVLMPPNNSYTKVAGAKEVRKLLKLENNINLNDYIKGEFPTNKEVKNILMKYADLSPKDFRNGLDDVKFLKSRSYMMQHSMSYNPKTNDWVGGSKIILSSHEFSSIKFNPLEEFKAGLGAIKKGDKMTFNQEYSFESLWHEILHAKTNTVPTRLSPLQVKNMETVNQFCARHTYVDFVKKLGGEAAHQEEILNKGYGYQDWINDFRGKLKSNNIDEKQAVNDLMPSLMEDYGSIGKKLNDFFATNTK